MKNGHRIVEQRKNDAMKTMNRLPKAVQNELRDSIEKQNEENINSGTKVRQARMILKLMKKYNFKRARHRFGLN